MEGAQTPQEITCFQMGSAQQKLTDRWTGRWVAEHRRQTRGKQAEGKAACFLAGLVPYMSLRAAIRSLIHHSVPDTQPQYLLVVP